MADADTSPRMKASDFHPYILEIFDGYVHGKLTKREFIREAAKFAAAGVTGLMILNQLQPDYALAQQVKADDPEIVTSRVTVQSPDGHGSISGLLARPAKAGGKLPAVLVVHENRGLNPYIEDVVRRLAKTGANADFCRKTRSCGPTTSLPLLCQNGACCHCGSHAACPDRNAPETPSGSQ